MQAQDLDKCKRRIIRTVARRLLYEKQPEDVVWDALSKDTGCDCRTLWSRLRSLTIKKLERLLSADDCREKIAPVAQMSATDWLLCDLVLVHENVDLIGLNKGKNRKDTKPLCVLFTLVQKFDIEGEIHPNEIAKKWSCAAKDYNSRGCQCSPMLLQRRWYQLKEALRDSFYTLWKSYKGNQKMYEMLEKNLRPTVLHSAIAKRYPEIVTSPLMKWEELIEKKLVALPEEIEHHSRGFVNIPQTEEDLIMVEPVIETIDLGVEDDKERPRTPVATSNQADAETTDIVNVTANTVEEIAANTFQQTVNSYNEEAVSIEETVNTIEYDSDINEPSTSYEPPPVDGLSNVRIVTAAHVPIENLENDYSDSTGEDYDDIVISNEEEDSDVSDITFDKNEETKPCKQHITEKSVADINATNIPDEVNVLPKGKLDTLKQNAKPLPLKDTIQPERLPNDDNSVNVIDLEPEDKGQEIDFESNISTTKIHKKVIKLYDDDDVKIVQAKPKRPRGPRRQRPPTPETVEQNIENINQEEAINYVNNKGNLHETALPKTLHEETSVQNVIRQKSVDIDTIIKNKTEEFLNQTSQRNVLMDDDDDEDEDYVNCDMIQNKAIDDIIKQKAEEFVNKIDKKEIKCLNFDGNMSFRSADVEFVDDGIEYIDDGIDDLADNEMLQGDITMKKEPSEDSKEYPNFDQKLLMKPIVYTTRLEYMSAFKGLHFYEIKHMHVINDVLDGSKPVLKTPAIKIKKEITSKPVEAEIERDESSDDKISEEFRVKLSSYILRKPRTRDYNPIQLCKNPDFNTRLKRLTVGFLSSTRNRALLKELKPMTIDLHKAFEPKLINGTLYLKPGDVSDSKVSKEFHEIQSSSVLPSAMPVQCLIDNVLNDFTPKQTCIDSENEVKNKNNKEVIEVEEVRNRKKVNRLRNIEDIRRINEKLLTAKVSPIIIENYISIKPSIKPQNEEPVDTEISNIEKAESNESVIDSNLNNKIAINESVSSSVNNNTADTNNHTETSLEIPSVQTPCTDTIVCKTADSHKQQHTDTSTSQSVAQKETRVNRKAPPVPHWYSNSSRQKTESEELLLTHDSLFKMIYHITGQYDNSIKKKGKKYGLSLNKSKKQEIAKNVTPVNSDTPIDESNKPKKRKKNRNKKFCCYLQYRRVYRSLGKRMNKSHRCELDDCKCCCKEQLEPPEVPPETPEADSEQSLKNACASIEIVVSQSNNTVSLSNRHVYIEKGSDASKSNIKTRIVKHIPKSPRYKVLPTYNTHNTTETSMETSVVDLDAPIIIDDENVVEHVSISNEAIGSDESNTLRVRNIQDLTSTNKPSNLLLVNSVTSENIERSEKVKDVIDIDHDLNETLPFHKIEIKPVRTYKKPIIKLQHHLIVPSTVTQNERDNSFIFIDGSMGQPVTPKSVVMTKKRKVSHVVMSSNKNDKSLPLFIGENCVLLTTVKIIGRPILKSQPKSPLPSGINIAISSNGEVKFNVDSCTVLTAEELEALPGIITFVKLQISGQGDAVDGDAENVVSVAAQELFPNYQNTKASNSVNVQSIVNPSEEQHANGITGESVANNSDSANSSQPQTTIMDTSTNSEENNLQIAEVSHQSDKGDDTKDTAINNASKDNNLRLDAIEINNDIVTENIQKPNGIRNLLSDLMEMSGISEEDVVPIPDPATRDIAALPTITLPAISEVNSNSNLKLPKTTELSVIQSLPELKYACLQNGLFYKLNCYTGVATFIDVRLKKCVKNSVPAQFNTLTIDLTDENEDKQELRGPSHQDKPSKPVNTIIKQHHQFSNASNDRSLLKQVKLIRATGQSIIKKPLLLPTKLSVLINLDDDLDTYESSTDPEPGLEHSTHSEESTNLEEAINLQESQNLEHTNEIQIETANDYVSDHTNDSSDDEPLAKKIKRRNEGSTANNTNIASIPTLKATKTSVLGNIDVNMESDSNIERFESDGDEMELEDLQLTFLDDREHSDDDSNKSDEDCILGV